MDQDYNDPSSIIKMINKFDSDETYFKQLLLEQLKRLITLQKGEKQELDIKTEQNLLSKVEDFCEKMVQKMSMERTRIRIKISNIKKFLQSHLKDPNGSKSVMNLEINYLMQAFIKNALKVYKHQFKLENKHIFESIQRRLSGKKEDNRLESIIQGTEMSECMLAPESDQQIFELLFKVYYTQYDFITVQINTYLKPRPEDECTMHANYKKNIADPEIRDRYSKPVFIGKLTSEYFFTSVKHSLLTSYKSKQYMDRNGCLPVSVSTFEYNIECIDYMLTQPYQKLSDFLHSQFNNNDKLVRAEPLFQDGTRRISQAVRNPMQFGNRINSTEGLKLRVRFTDAQYIRNLNKSVQRLSINDYDLIKILGEGAFAKVLLVRKKASGKLFAMKVIDKKKIMMTEEDCNGFVPAEELATRNMYRVKQIISERNIFSVMNQDLNPFIVQLHSAFTSKNYLYMVLDLCPGGDLFSLIQKHKNFTPQQAKFIFSEILVAVEHLHNHDILYRDLKPENIIIDEWGHFKLTDFGLSKENFSDEDMAKTVCGSPEYFCPEILQDQPYGRTIDFYSLGVLLYELITGLPPHYNSDQFQMQKDIVSKEPKFSHLSGDALDLIKGLLEKNPDERLGNIGGIKEIRGHPFFSDINWDDVINKRYKYHKQLFMKIDVTQSNFNQDISLKDKNGQYEIGINVQDECGHLESKHDKQQKIELVTVLKRSKSITDVSCKSPQNFNSNSKNPSRRQTIHKMKYEFSKIVAQEQVNSKSTHNVTESLKNDDQEVVGSPWYKALKPIDAINEVPEMVEVDDNFNEDQQKQYRSQSNYNVALSPSNKYNNNYDGFSYRKVSEIGTNSIVPSTSYLEVFKNTKELVESNRNGMLFKNNQRTGDATAGLEARRSRMGSQFIKIPQRISTEEKDGFTPNESPFKVIAESQDESPNFGLGLIDRKSSSFKMECELKEEVGDHANTTSHYILTTNQNSKGGNSTRKHVMKMKSNQSSLQISSFNHNSSMQDEGELTIQDFMKKSKTPKETIIDMKGLDREINQVEINFDYVDNETTPQNNDKIQFSSQKQEKQYEENNIFVEQLLSLRNDAQSHSGESVASDSCSVHNIHDQEALKELREKRKLTKIFSKQIYEASSTTKQPKIEPEKQMPRRRRVSEGNKRANNIIKENSPQKNEVIQRISTQLLNNFEQNFQWDRDQKLVIKQKELKISESNETENQPEQNQNQKVTRESVANFIDMIAEQSAEDDDFDPILNDNNANVGTARKSRRFDSKNAYNYFSTDKNLVKQMECFRDSLLVEPQAKSVENKYPTKLNRRGTQINTTKGIDIRTANRQEQKLFSIHLRASGILNLGRKRNLPLINEFNTLDSRQSKDLNRKSLPESRVVLSEESNRGSFKQNFSPTRDKESFRQGKKMRASFKNSANRLPSEIAQKKKGPQFEIMPKIGTIDSITAQKRESIKSNFGKEDSVKGSNKFKMPGANQRKQRAENFLKQQLSPTVSSSIGYNNDSLLNIQDTQEHTSGAKIKNVNCYLGCMGTTKGSQLSCIQLSSKDSMRHNINTISSNHQNQSNKYQILENLNENVVSSQVNVNQSNHLHVNNSNIPLHQQSEKRLSKGSLQHKKYPSKMSQNIKAMQGLTYGNLQNPKMAPKSYRSVFKQDQLKNSKSQMSSNTAADVHQANVAERVSDLNRAQMSLSIKNSAEMTQNRRLQEGSLTVNTNKSEQISNKEGDQDPTTKPIETDFTPASSSKLGVYKKELKKLQVPSKKSDVSSFKSQKQQFFQNKMKYQNYIRPGSTLSHQVNSHRKLNSENFHISIPELEKQVSQAVKSQVQGPGSDRPSQMSALSKNTDLGISPKKMQLSSRIIQKTQGSSNHPSIKLVKTTFHPMPIKQDFRSSPIKNKPFADGLQIAKKTKRSKHMQGKQFMTESQKYSKSNSYRGSVLQNSNIQESSERAKNSMQTNQFQSDKTASRKSSGNLSLPSGLLKIYQQGIKGANGNQILQ